MKKNILIALKIPGLILFLFNMYMLMPLMLKFKLKRPLAFFAKRYLEKVDPDISVCHYYLGCISYWEEKYEEGIKHFSKQIELTKDYEKPYFYVGLGYENLKDYAKAKEYYKKSLSIKNYWKAEAGLERLEKVN